MTSLPTLDKQVFDRLKAIWENVGHFLIDDPETFDQTIARAINAINSVPDLIVISSREGDPKCKHNVFGNIMVGCLNPEPLFQIFELATKHDPTYLNRFNLSFSYHNRPLIIDGERNRFFPAWTISWNTLSKTWKEGVGFLNQAAETVASRYH